MTRLLALALVAGLAGSSCASPKVESAADNLPTLDVGDCFIRERVVKVACSEPHTDEVVGSFVLSFTDYPTADDLRAETRSQCKKLSALYLGATKLPADAQTASLSPEQPAFERGMETVVCSLVLEGRPERTGSFLD